MDDELQDMSTDDLLHQLAPVALASNTTFQNWSGTYRCAPLTMFEPETEYQCELVLELARRRGQSVSVTGVGHSPSDIACTNGYLIRTLKLDSLIEVNTQKNFVTIQGGMTLDKLHAHLDVNGLAMSNVGSISDQTIGGVTTIATHGTGLNFKVVPTYVISLVLLLASGEKVRCSREERSDLFLATLCGFGATGLVLTIQLQVEPAFRLREVSEIVTFPYALSTLDSLVAASQHVRLWWFPSVDEVVVGSFDRVQEPPDTAKSASSPMDFVGTHGVQIALLLGTLFRFLIPWACWLALKLWFNRGKTVRIDLSHRVFNLDCKYKQYTTEWAVPYEKAASCLRELHSWLCREESSPDGLRPHFPIEIRFSDGDDIFLSPAYGRKTCWIGVIQHKPYGLPVPYKKLFKAFEEIMGRYSGRPHWAKAHSLGPKELSKLYPKLYTFIDVLQTYDPHGTFRNEYVRRHIFGEDISARIFKSRP